MAVFRLLLLAVAAIIVALLVVVFVSQRRFRVQVDGEVRALFADDTSSVGPAELAARWDSLPEPVKRHLRYCIPAGAPAIRSARLRHGGAFRPSPKQGWFPIRGEQYFTVGKPGFIWNATIRMPPGLWVEARDCLAGERGNMLVRVLSTLTVADAKGPAMDQGGAMRWLAEAVWFPYALVGDRVAWEPVDERSARATLRYSGPPASLVFTLDDQGRFALVRGERYNETEGRMRAWRGACRDYREFGGFRVPTAIEAVWKLDSGDYSYARFQVTQLEYGVEQRFPAR